MPSSYTPRISLPLLIGSTASAPSPVSIAAGMTQYVGSASPATLNGAITRTDWIPSADTSNSATGFLNAMFAYGAHSINGLGVLEGINATATNRGDGNVATIIGFATHIGNQTATYGTAHTGVVVDLIGFKATPPVTTGVSDPITNAYGVYIDTQKVTGVTNGYGIYQASSADTNVFAGPINVNGGIVMASGKTLILGGGGGTIGGAALRFTTGNSGGLYTTTGTTCGIFTNETTAALWDDSGNLVNRGSISCTNLMPTGMTIAPGAGGASITMKCVAVGNNAQFLFEHATDDTFAVRYYNNSLGSYRTAIVIDAVNQVATLSGVLQITPGAAPGAPAEGMVYANSTDHHFYFYNGTTWKQLDN